LKNEIDWEPFRVSPDGLVKDLGRHAVKRGEVAIENDAPSADRVDRRERRVAR
jgi:hypothetical protein